MKTIVDLAKARAYADAIEDETSAEWLRELADEVESLQRSLESARRSEQAALSDATAASEERDATLAALRELYDSIVTMLSDIGRKAS
jgi:Mg2+ and Co2+ transporter CorA